MVVGDDPRIADYAGDFAALIEEALPNDRSIEFIRNVADEML
jgi:hypothetical protein